MVPDNLRAALMAATFGSLVVLSGVGIGGVVAAQQPSEHVQSPQPTQLSTVDPGGENESSPSGDEVVERFEERIESLETLAMTYETNVTVDENTTLTTTQTIWADYENDRIRTERETNQTHTITVRNETGTVTYDVENNQVNRFNTSGDMSQLTPVDGLVNDTEITYEGRERLDGQETYRLSVTPNTSNELSGSLNVTVWLDTETYYPTTVTSELEGGDHDYEMTAQLRNVTLNEPIDDDRFTIDVPEDAEEPDYSVPEVTNYDSLSALRDDTNRSVPSPDVPDTYSFEQGYVTNGDDYHSITLRYTNDDDETLHVVKRPATEYDFDESDQYERIGVGNATGYYSEYEFDGNTTSVVVLPCEDTTYSVSGDLSRHGTVDVAESLTCE